METKLNVHAIFDSIDGEENGFGGAGELTTFIRLKGCNLLCSFCDTKYAQQAAPVNMMTIDEIVQQVHFPKVTITGGEPLLQQGDVEELCNRLIFERHCNVSVETNGSIRPEYFTEGLRYVVDFKLPSSGVMETMKSIVFASLRYIDVIKFVISDEEDYRYAKMVIQAHPSWEPKKVMSPTLGCLKYRYGLDGAPMEPTAYFDMSWPRQLAEMMIRDRVDAQYSLQLHKILWPGAKEER